MLSCKFSRWSARGVNVNVNLYSASSQKHLQCAQCAEYWSKTHVFNVRRKQSICMSGSRKLFWNKFHVVGPVTAKVRRQYVSSWNRGTTSIYLDGGWRNEDAVAHQLERPVCTAQTDNPVPGQYVTRSATSSQCSSEWWSRCVKSWSYFFVPLTTRAAAQNADSVTNLVEKMRRIDEFSGPDGMSAGLTQQWLLTADCSTPW